MLKKIAFSIIFIANSFVQSNYYVYSNGFVTEECNTEYNLQNISGYIQARDSFESKGETCYQSINSSPFTPMPFIKSQTALAAFNYCASNGLANAHAKDDEYFKELRSCLDTINYCNSNYPNNFGNCIMCKKTQYFQDCINCTQSNNSMPQCCTLSGDKQVNCMNCIQKNSNAAPYCPACANSQNYLGCFSCLNTVSGSNQAFCSIITDLSVYNSDLYSYAMSALLNPDSQFIPKIQSCYNPESPVNTANCLKDKLSSILTHDGCTINGIGSYCSCRNTEQQGTCQYGRYRPLGAATLLSSGVQDFYSIFCKC